MRRPHRSVSVIPARRGATAYADSRRDRTHVQHHHRHHERDRVRGGRHPRPVQRPEHELGQRAYCCWHQLHDFWPHPDLAAQGGCTIAHPVLGRRFRGSTVTEKSAHITVSEAAWKGINRVFLLLVSDPERRKSRNQRSCCQRKQEVYQLMHKHRDRNSVEVRVSTFYRNVKWHFSDFCFLSSGESLCTHCVCVSLCVKLRNRLTDRDRLNVFPVWSLSLYTAISQVSKSGNFRKRCSKLELGDIHINVMCMTYKQVFFMKNKFIFSIIQLNRPGCQQPIRRQTWQGWDCDLV